ncbi:uncharacterized protein LOC107271999 [Cephus cinctus]|uniref:Uncharacterized protein LOC107271999 n=1 Tax=Cephus cinctus TaxID=211228 RepID=A0AAJ7C7X8_CEPCN|nr:uncharacterized protein LOC107271999 [Cephus cinctus]
MVRKNYDALNKEFSQTVWMKLAAATLILIQLFNRRRAGEIERIFIDDFRSQQKIDNSTIGEAYTKFTPDEKRAAMKYLLLKYRPTALVNKRIPYLFGIPGTLKGDYKNFRACELIRKFAVDCGAENPQTLRGTILRKQIATMCITFNLTDNDISDLANFLGYADKIHKDYYRQPIISREILHVSKLLEAVQGKNDDSEGDSDDGGNVCKTGSSTLGTSVNRSETEIRIGTNEHRHTNENPATQLSGDQEPEFGDTNYDKGNSSDDEIFAKPKAKKKRSTSPYGKCRRTRWNEKEKEIARRYFSQSIATKTLPSFQMIQEIIDANPGIFNRNLASSKSWVSNQIKKGS